MDNKMGQSVIAIIITGLTVFIVMMNSSASGGTLDTQSPKHGAEGRTLFSSDLVFGNDRIEVHHIIVKAHSKLDLKFRGGTIVMLTDFPFHVDLPLTGSTTTQFSAGDVIRIPPGEYPLENSSEKPLEFLSIELPK